LAGQLLEHEAAHATANYTVLEWIDAPGLRYELIAGELEVAPGIFILPTPGHSPGHQSVLVEAHGARTVLAGQAVYTLDEWLGADDAASSGEESAWDRPRYRESLARLRAIEPETVVFGHDVRRWQRS
jgi:N-acyl homoserine lactone hydrolase